MSAIEFTVFGEPVGKARPRIVRTKSGRSMAYTPTATKNYEIRVKNAFFKGYDICDAFSDGQMLKVSILAVFEPPTSISKKKRQEMLDGHIRPIKKPDTDNIAKAILDALNGIAFDDDSRVVDLNVQKVYGSAGKVVVKIEEADPWKDG